MFISRSLPTLGPNHAHCSTRPTGAPLGNELPVDLWLVPPVPQVTWPLLIICVFVEVLEGLACCGLVVGTWHLVNK